MSAKRLVLDAALDIVMGVAVAMAVAVRSDFRRYRDGGRMSGGTMGQDDDERRNDECKSGRQRDEVARRVPSPAMARRLAHAAVSSGCHIPLGGILGLYDRTTSACNPSRHRQAAETRGRSLNAGKMADVCGRKRVMVLNRGALISKARSGEPYSTSFQVYSLAFG